ncbi:NAD(P)-dependent dehydrogenase (short-subunit alcohol dehydrogenase family) [Deinobacterium chartae]|uniref:NAD(P)-dependent dehydrogenase (Short-subunit alcohol dehydrogenase family) n=1 Tax=Deinobacterium chartae TaxID=521158 RepID=A0A841I0E9_9DEIO|nr:SDR family oxidoreductase [Deinobacterium chartae]MBB6098444.1 NAD(P)-dependent dehydrogenase (short-subunit alcohol dehydrogenase family) [Deinobacterium chartae]
MRIKSAFITGGSKGIGYAVAQALVTRGVNVTITARNEQEVQQAAEQLSAKGPGRALGLPVDVRDYEAQRAAIERTAQEFGGLDFLFANAGVGRFAPVQDLSLEDWQAVIDTNLTGVFYGVKAAVPYLKDSQGYIITLSSLAGRNPFAGGSAYNASKFGLNGFSEAIMLDLRELGIQVSTIMPGSVATHFNNHTPSEQDAWKIQPEDIAQIVVDLLEMNPRTLPSRIEVRPSQPPKR